MKSLADGPTYLRWRILDRIRRFFRPTLRRPLLFLMAAPLHHDGEDMVDKNQRLSQ
jgi:hypothetical protein